MSFELTHRHYRRLRFYWRGRKGSGGASNTDQIDLDLAAAGLIERRETHAIVMFRITPAGEVELSAENKREIERRQPHHDLAGRLAQWLRDKGRITWENIQMVSTQAGRTACVRPDVYSMEKTTNPLRMNPVVHEVKVSRADFLADLKKPEKRAGYACFSESVCYVAPAGMIKPEEIPDGCGLLEERSPGQFTLTKRSKRKKIELTAQDFMNLILKPGAFHPLEP
jgi:hypothetical protein